MKQVKVIIYTDGASRGNGSEDSIGAYGSVLICGDKRKEISKAFTGVTNNKMELSAVVESLKLLKFACEVQIYSDSKYVCDAINKKWIYSWKDKNWTRGKKNNTISLLANKELWIELYELLQTHNVQVDWVKGHGSNVGNIRADELCNEAMDEYIANNY